MEVEERSVFGVVEESVVGIWGSGGKEWGPLRWCRVGEGAVRGAVITLNEVRKR